MGWLKRWRERHLTRWRAGEIDDATFARKQVQAIWKAFGLIFGVTIAVSMIGLASEGKSLTQVLTAAGLIALVGVVVALRAGRIAAYEVRIAVLQRNRQRVEANPAAPLVHSHVKPPAEGRFYGVYRRSNRYTYSLMVRTAIIGGLTLGLYLWIGFTPIVALAAGGVAVLALWCIYLRLDRRPFLDISAEGIWCRAWGKQRLGYGDFKAVYPRQSRWDRGITLVPRDRELLRRRLSWLGRASLRQGGGGWGGPAHVGTLTLWANRLDLPQAELLRAVQAEIVARRSGESD